MSDEKKRARTWDEVRDAALADGRITEDGIAAAREALVRAETRCRAGCKTQDHESYAECLKAAAIQIGKLR